MCLGSGRVIVAQDTSGNNIFLLQSLSSPHGMPQNGLLTGWGLYRKLACIDFAWALGIGTAFAVTKFKLGRRHRQM